MSINKIKYKKLRRFDTDVHVVSFMPSVNVKPTLIRSTIAKKITQFFHNWFRRKKYEEACGINLSFFDIKSLKPYGLLFTDAGFLIQPPSVTDAFTEMLYMKDGRIIIENMSLETFKTKYQKDCYFAAGLSYELVKAGKKHIAGTKSFDHYKYDNPRTFIGQNEKTKEIFWCVAEGRSTTDRGINADEQAEILLEFGCTNGINADGGGSSALILKGKVMNTLSDGSLRKIPTMLMLYIRDGFVVEEDIEKVVEPKLGDTEIIENGIIQLNKIDGIPFKVDLIPESNTKARPRYNMIPLYKTIHNTGNSSSGANAEMHTRYVDNTIQYISWHFTVDDKQIIQELPINESAWHAGDGSNGTGNRKTIGIEICEQKGIDWTKARENAIKLIAFLDENIDTFVKDEASTVPHQKWSKSNFYCPHIILDEGWDLFLNDIEKYKNKSTSEETPVDGNIEDYKLEGIKYLYDNKLLNDYNGWVVKLEEPLPSWASFLLLSRIHKAFTREEG